MRRDETAFWYVNEAVANCQMVSGWFGKGGLKFFGLIPDLPSEERMRGQYYMVVYLPKSQLIEARRCRVRSERERGTRTAKEQHTDQ